MEDFLLTDLNDINPELNNIAIQITNNNLGEGHLQTLILRDTSTNHGIFLVRLIYHVAVMLSSKRYHKLFSPIALLYDNPISLQDKLFPTMIDDQFLAAKEGLSTESGKWHSCPNGHTFSIGEVREC